MNKFSWRGKTEKKRRVQTLSDAWRWDLDLTTTTDDLVAPKVIPEPRQWITKGHVPELLAVDAPVAPSTEGMPFRTFSSVTDDNGIFMFSLRGMIGDHECRINQYRVDFDGGALQDMTVLLLDLGSSLRLPWMKVERPVARKTPQPWSAHPFTATINDEPWRVEARTEVIAREVFSEPVFQHRMARLGSELLSVEFGSHWLLIRTMQVDITQMRGLRQTAVDLARSLPMNVIRVCGNPQSPTPVDTYDTTVWQQVLADRLHDRPPARRSI